MPHRHWKTTAFVAGLRLTGIAAPFVLDGPIDRNAFETYVAEVLVPELAAGDVVVMANFSRHKGPRVRAMIDAVGASLLYLPPCSPDFNPIEITSPSLKPSCERPPSDPSQPYGTPSAAASILSRQTKPQTSSQQQDMNQIKPKPL